MDFGFDGDAPDLDIDVNELVEAERELYEMVPTEEELFGELDPEEFLGRPSGEGVPRYTAAQPKAKKRLSFENIGIESEETQKLEVEQGLNEPPRPRSRPEGKRSRPDSDFDAEGRFIGVLESEAFSADPFAAVITADSNGSSSAARQKLRARPREEEDGIAPAAAAAVEDESAIGGERQPPLKKARSGGERKRQLSRAASWGLDPDGESQRTFVYSRIPAKGDFESVTSSDGRQRVYLLLEPLAAFNARAERSAWEAAQKHRELLSTVPVRRLLAEIEKEKEAEALEAMRQEQAEHLFDSDPEDDPERRLQKRRARAEREKARKRQQERLIQEVGTQLWVDKYAPRSFVDLLSNERINREVLQWLKLWDPFVFGKPLKQAPPKSYSSSSSTPSSSNFLFPMARRFGSSSGTVQRAQESPQSNRGNIPKSSSSSSSSSSKHASSFYSRKEQKQWGLAPDGRPEQKVILICGPPGLGKTTLAHVLAKHAGYQPVEINASDDRSAEVLRNRIRNATEMNPIFGLNKPNCIILDEIDGATGGGEDGKGAISELLKIIKAEGRKPVGGKRKRGEEGEEEGGGAGSEAEEGEETVVGGEEEKKGRGGGRRRRGAAGSSLPKLSRPIICICNDQYAPVLRPLRQIARVFVLDKPNKTKLIDRLKYIAEREGMKVDARVLSSLCDVTEMDIRSCINALQWAHARSHGKGANAATTELLLMLAGQKDITRGRFEVWEAVFSSRPSERSRLLMLARSPSDGPEPAASKRSAFAEQEAAAVREVYQLFQDHGDPEKLLDGIQHNYLRMNFHDPTLDKMVEAADWLSLGDQWAAGTYGEDSGVTDAYVPYAAVAIHLLCATSRKPKLELSSASWESYQARSRNLNILNSFLSPGNILRHHGLTPTRVVIEALSHILDILAADFRTPNLHLLSQKGKEAVAEYVDTMISLKLNYVKDDKYGPDSKTVHFRLDPPIDLVSTFNFNRAQLDTKELRREINSKVKQALAREVEVEQMRRLEAARTELGDDAAEDALLAGPSSSLSSSSSNQQQQQKQPHQHTVSVPEYARLKPKQQQQQQQGDEQARNAFDLLGKRGGQQTKASVVAAATAAEEAKEREKEKKMTFLEEMAKKRKKARKDRSQHPVHFSYQEGYSNAVRRNVPVKHFLL